MINMEDNILIVDDEALISLGLQMMLNQMGYKNCFTARTVDESVLKADKYRPKLILMDYRLKNGTTGIEATNIIRQTHHCPVIFITGSNETETRNKIYEARPSGLLIKPILPKDLRQAIDDLVFV